MAAIFTKTDKGLMMRAARVLAEEACCEEAKYGPVWAASKEGKEAKLRYDRLLRDERDLRALARRLEQELPDIVFPATDQSASAPAGAGNGD